MTLAPHPPRSLRNPCAPRPGGMGEVGNAKATGSTRLLPGGGQVCTAVPGFEIQGPIPQTAFLAWRAELGPGRWNVKSAR